VEVPPSKSKRYGDVLLIIKKIESDLILNYEELEFVFHKCAINQKGMGKKDKIVAYAKAVSECQSLGYRQRFLFSSAAKLGEISR